MTTIDRWPGRMALMVSHCAGMVDLVALPIWVGTLISVYGFDPQQTGGLVTLFLSGVVGSSLLCAARFRQLPKKLTAAAGFVAAAILFVLLSQSRDYNTMALLHLLAGASVGCSLSMTHGTIGHSKRPQFLFAIVGFALGVFGIIFLGITPKLIAFAGGETLFLVFAGLMLIASVVCVFAFPQTNITNPLESDNRKTPSPFSKQVWSAIAGISLMALVQAMIFSFLERMGADRGFSLDAITLVFILSGIFNLLPPIAAAALEHKLSPRIVVSAGPLLQGLIALLITWSNSFVLYMSGAIVFTGIMIFTHTFAFGLLSRLDVSSRAVAATPAMLMTGSALGPIIGGTLVKMIGYPALGLTAVTITILSMLLFRSAIYQQHSLTATTPHSGIYKKK
jgi:predicted MFS family arabinose efflux permease